MQIAADRGGTSDPYAVVELVQIENDTRVGAKLQTGRRSKTLAPKWNEVKTWSGLDQPVNNFAIRVAVFDKDTFSSTSLGSVLIDKETAT